MKHVHPKPIPEIEVRYSSSLPRSQRMSLTESSAVFSVLSDIWDWETIEFQECFVLLLLNRAHIPLDYRRLSLGGLAGTVVDARHVFGLAVTCNAAGIIVAHNHPSGALYPSRQDIALTHKLQEAGKLLDIVLLDHLILTPDHHYYSFADDGKL